VVLPAGAAIAILDAVVVSSRMPFSLTPELRQTIETVLRGAYKDYAWSEEFFLRVIARPRGKRDVCWATIALRDCGTFSSMPALKSLEAHPMQDAKATAILSIAQIAGASETDYLAARLLDPGYRARTFALWAIGEVGDARALDAVHAYIKHRKKSMSAVSADSREQQEAIAFFYRVLGPAETEALLASTYGFLKTSLIESLSQLPEFATTIFERRVPKLVGPWRLAK